MATERLSMRKTREILRQKRTLERTHREVASSLNVGAGTVGDVMVRAKAAGLSSLASIERLSDDELEAVLYGTRFSLAREAALNLPSLPARCC